MANYTTNLGKRTNTFLYEKQPELSETTKEYRGRVRGLLDDFCLFQWRGKDVFEHYGAFILNEKNSLKFFNGPNFSNEYTKPQFSSYASNLTGVKFDIQKISFKIGVYWISAEDYRKFIDFLDPYAIDYLSFGWDYEWSYLVKLTGRKDTTKYIVGHEDGKPMYYTEMDLNFEVQGPAQARTNLPYNWESIEGKISLQDDQLQPQPITELAFPIRVNFDIPIVESRTSLQISLKYNEKTETETKIETMMNVSLHNLTSTEQTNIGLTYDSETGLIFMDRGDSSVLLSLVTTNTTGEKIIQDMECNKKFIPPFQEDYWLDLAIKNANGDPVNWSLTEDTSAKVSIVAYGRRLLA